jgi:hypothetical protein
MSKGSKRRPMLVSQSEFDKNWKRIFRKKKDVAKTGKSK